MTTSTRFLAGALGATLALALTACGGGNGPAALPGISGTQTPVDAAVARTMVARFKIVLHRHRRKKRHMGYVPPTTASATVAVGSLAPVTVNLTSGSPGCTSSQPVTCSFNVPAPIGTDAFTVTLYGAKNAGGSALAVGHVTQKIAQGKLNRITIVCDGVVASLGLALGQTNPVSGLATTIPLTITALDADSNTIISPGGYETPIAVSDSDTAHTQIQLGSGTPGSSVSVTDPSQTLNAIYDGSSVLSSATFTAQISGSPGITPATAVLTPSAAQIVIDTANGGPAIGQDLIGANLPAWTTDTQSYVETAFANTGLHLMRWPGGSFADEYVWNGNGGSPSSCNGGYFDPSSTFDNVMTGVAQPANLDVAITLNYGSNAACSGPGTPAQAAAWVTYSKSQGYPVKYWTVGNEVYGSWEYDLHTVPHDPTTYANAMIGTNGFYKKVKAADSSAKVGIAVSGPVYSGGSWDSTVLPNASGYYDYVEYHYYAQQGVGAGSEPGDAENDAYLLGQGVTDFANALTALRTEMTNDGVATSVPIYLGELNSIVSTAGKQTVSITNGLFAGMAIAETMKQPGVTMASWWLAFGDCETAATGGNFSPSLYGFQNFGTYTLFSDQSSGCGTENSVAAGTAFPDGNAFGILSQFDGSGSVMRNVSTAISTDDGRFYADTLGTNGYGVLLFNLNETTPVTYSVQLSNAAAGQQFTGTQIVYDKALYDQSQTNAWPGSTSASIGTVGTTFYVTLQPWSMNLVTLVPLAADARHRKAGGKSGGGASPVGEPRRLVSARAF